MDARPTKRHQTPLLVSGSMMIFHVVWTNQIFGEYYTSPDSNIPDAIGQGALVSLAGTIGAGLTWAGSIFVNPWMARIQNVRTITVLGAFLMSLGLFLASFNTKVSANDTAKHGTAQKRKNVTTELSMEVSFWNFFFAPTSM